MPAAGKKGVYLAKTVGELNKLAGDIPACTNARIFLKSAEKVFKNAEQLYVQGDEEKAYVMYMKFFNLIQAVKKSSEYKKNEKFYKELIGTKNCIKAINQAEKLSESLKDRYDELEAEQVIKKLEKLNEDKPPHELHDDRPNAEKSNAENKAEAPITGLKLPTGLPNLVGSISAQELYTIMMGDEKTLLLMDIRQADDYQLSHINYKACINVPQDIIKPGVTVPYIEKSLPDESRSWWDRRDLVEHVILLDWHCSLAILDNHTSLLRCLKDAIYKWDKDVSLRDEPLVLEGGYDDWLLYYPTLTTNANIPRPPTHISSTSSPPSLETIDYDMDMDFLKDPKKKKVPTATLR